MNLHIKLARIILQVLKSPLAGTGRMPANSLLDEIASLRPNGPRLVGECARGSYREEEGEDYFAHERPELRKDNQHIVPLKAWRALLDGLMQEIEVGSGDHRVWVLGREDRTIEVRQPLVTLLDLLRKRTIINLDGTPNLALLRHIFPVVDHAVPVQENLRVIQCTDGVYGKRSAATALPARLVKILRNGLRHLPPSQIGVLANKRTLVELKWIDEFGEPTKGAFRDEHRKAIRGSKGIVVGYWGRDERATNKYKDCDLLIISGMHLPPIDEVARDIQAWRLSLGQNQPTMAEETRVYRSYGYIDDLGIGRAFRCPRHEDPDVEAELRRVWSANLQQAIGRLRANRTTRPKLVVIDTALPADRIRVHGLGSLDGTDIGEQSEALRAQTQENKARAKERLGEICNIARPIYQELLRAGGSPTLSELKQRGMARGIEFTEWEWRRIRAALFDGSGK